MRTFFDRELDTVATFWRVFRRDGVAFGFSTHDRDLLFSGIRHRTAPGMMPAAIRMTSEISDDSAEVEGALSHDAIRAEDVAAALFDEAAIVIGAVDWETLEHEVLYTGRIGEIQDNKRSFNAELRSAKHILDTDLVPRTSPTCRAEFCGPGCGLSARRFTTLTTVSDVRQTENQIAVADAVDDDFIDGQIRLLDGPQTGLVFGILDVESGWLTLDRPLAPGTIAGVRAELRQGCDHTLATCADRFENALNFRGEPFLPGNDLLSRYGQPSG
jgi:uncharacterized phage protein (TIGR02218 family)